MTSSRQSGLIDFCLNKWALQAWYDCHSMSSRNHLQHHSELVISNVIIGVSLDIEKYCTLRLFFCTSELW